LMDRFGRKITACIFYLGASVSMVVLFTSHTFSMMLGAEIATMFCYQASRAATSALSTELFPTEIRATGYSLCVQAFGQFGWALAPIIIGVFSAPMGGLGNAAALFAVGPLIGIVLIVLFAPETLGKTLEELSP
jgi:MFS family permease